MRSRFLPGTILILLLFLTALNTLRVSAGTPLTLSPPYAFGTTWTDPNHTGSATVNSKTGTGSVTAKPTSQASGYQSIGAIVFATGFWVFTGPTQPSGSVEVQGLLQNVVINQPSGVPASVVVFLAMEDLNPDGSIAKVSYEAAQTMSIAGSYPAQSVDHTISSWSWTQNHLYRAVVFVVASGFAASSSGVTIAAEADASFTLSNIIWSYPGDPFQASPAVVATIDTQAQGLPGTTITLNCTNFHVTGNLKVRLYNGDGSFNMTLTPPGGFTPNQNPAASGNFTVNIALPSNITKTGTYTLRVANVTGNDPAETFIIFPVASSSAPSLPTALVIPLLMIIAILPVVFRRKLRNRLSG